jgi:hypothetical protein
MDWKVLAAWRHTVYLRPFLAVGLIGGPDVWEVIAVFRSFEDIQHIADWLDQPASAIETATRNYYTHRAEIDAWIRRNEGAAEAAERIARARQVVS